MARLFDNSVYLLTLLLLTLLVLSLLEEVVDGAAVGGGGKRKNCRRGRRGGGNRRKKRGSFACSSDSVAEYKLTFYGTWSREKFPRMYPTVRPPAQWSKLVGRSHAPTYQMWMEGGYADPALQRLAELGDSLLYDSQPQGYHDVYDTFSCEALKGGEGKTSTFLMADGAHSKLSFAVKMIPSPDWFVGLDGLDLCRRGRWRTRAHVNLRPMDAGTDRGYTFTSPNWPSNPKEPIYRITSSYPNHPASAFLYPEYRKLPRVAYVDVERVAQYHRRGGVSSLKNERGPNIVVFGAKTTTTTTSTTTTSTTPALVMTSPVTMATALNGSRRNGSDSVHSLVETSTVVGTLRPRVELAKGNKASENVKSPAVVTLFQQTLLTQRTPALTTTTATTTTAPTKATPPRSDMTAPTNLHTAGGIPTSSNSQKIDSPEEGVKLDRPDNGIQAYQTDDARTRSLNDYHQMSSHGTAKDNGDHSKENYSRPNLADIGEETASDEETLKNIESVHHDANTRNDAARSPSVRQPIDANPESSDSHSRGGTSLTSPKNESPDSETFPIETQNRIATATTTATTTITSAATGLGQKDVSGFRLPQAASAIITSPKTIDTTKAAPETTSAGPHSTNPSITSSSRSRPRLGRPQMRTGRYLKPRPVSKMGSPTARTQPRSPARAVEPTTSQSERTFDEPQFPAVAATYQSEDDELVHCQVGTWAMWSSCSRTCGFGVRTRTREVLFHSRNGGMSCPLLQQESLCGSMRACKWKHFTFLKTTKRPQQGRQSRRRRFHRGQHPERPPAE